MKGLIKFSDTKQLLVLITCVVLWVIGLTNILEKHALGDLLSISEKGIEALSTVFSFKTLAASGSGIPIVSGLFDSVKETLHTIEQYLTISNSLVLAQIILLSIGKSVVFKILSLLALVGTIFTATQKFCLQVFIILMLVSPGLAVYVSTIELIVTEVNVDFHSPLTKKLDLIDAEVKEHKVQHQSKYDSLVHHQKKLEAQKHEGDSSLTWIQKKDDAAKLALQKVDETATSGLRKTASILQVGGKEVIVASLNMMVSSLLQFLLLPGLYAYLILQLFKRFFGVKVEVKPVVLRPKTKPAAPTNNQVNPNTKSE